MPGLAFLLKKERTPLGERRPSIYASKPVSRVLSFKTAIYLDVLLPTRSSHLLSTAGSALCTPAVLLRIEFTAMGCSQPSGGLLPPPFHPYLAIARRYLSVALFLGSPPAGVTRYSYPVEPGLSSEQTFRSCPAAVQLACKVYFISIFHQSQTCFFIEIFSKKRYNRTNAFEGIWQGGSAYGQ